MRALSLPRLVLLALCWFGVVSQSGCALLAEPKKPGNGDDDGGMRDPDMQDLEPGTLLPVEDVSTEGMLGKGDVSVLVNNVDDGPSFDDADDEQTMVYTEDGRATSHHMVGYLGNVSGRLGMVEVSFRASKGSAEGTVEVHIYDGSTKVASSKARPLAIEFRNYRERFENLSISNADNLRTEIILRNTLGSGVLRYTQVWVVVEPK